MDNLSQGSKKSSFSPIIWLIVIIAILVVGYMLFNSETGVPVPGIDTEVTEVTLSEEEREEVVQAILTTDAVIRSGDVQMIREHIANVDPEGISQITDEQIMELSDFYAEFAGEITAEDFHSESAVWVAEENRVVITIEKDGEPRVFEAAKVNGVWY